MKLEIILFLFLILIPACGFGQIDNPDSVKSIPGTGDIIVVARGCTPPPYETGLRLELNRMPENPPKTIVTSFPDSIREDRELLRKSLSIYGRNANGRLDTANGFITIKPHIYFYDDNSVAVGITDSIGRYIFSNLQPGNYQLILSNSRIYNPRDEYEQSNRFFSQRKDFPEWEIVYPPNIEKQLYGWPDRVYSKMECLPTIMDNIKVAPDSISIVKIAVVIHYNESVFINTAKTWKKEIKARDGQNEDNKDE